MAGSTIYWDDSLHCKIIKKEDDFIRLIEECVEQVNNGAFINIDTKNQGYSAGFYYNNQVIGPIMDISKGKLDYSFIDKNGKTIGFKIKMNTSNKEKAFLIGGYDYNGNFLGRSICIDFKGNISFIKSGVFGEIDNKQIFLNNIVDLVKNYPIVTGTFFKWDENDKRYRKPIVYHYDNAHDKIIDAKGVMFGKFPFKINEVKKKDLNYQFDYGYGMYQYNDYSFRLGHVSRGDGKAHRSSLDGSTYYESIDEGYGVGANILGFDGPGIYKKNKGIYSIGSFLSDSNDKENLLVNIDKGEYQISFYDKGVQKSLFFKINLEYCDVGYYDQGVKSNFNLRIDLSTFNLIYTDKLGAEEEIVYPFSINEDDIAENGSKYFEYIFNKEKEKLIQSLKEKYSNYIIDYQISNFNNMDEDNTPKVIKLILKQCINYNNTILIIDEPVSQLESMTYNEEISQMIKNLHISSINLKELPKAVFSRCINLEELTIEYGYIEIIRKKAFANNKVRETKFPDTTKLIERAAFLNCEYLSKIYVPSGCKVEEGAVSEKCAVIYYGDNLTQEEIEKNKLAEEVLKQYAKHFKKLYKEADKGKEIKEKKEKIVKEKVKKEKIKKQKKERRTKKSLKDILGKFGSFFVAILLFIFKPFIYLFKKISYFFRYKFSDTFIGFWKVVGKFLFNVIIFVPRCIFMFFRWIFKGISRSFRRAKRSIFNSNNGLAMLTIIIGIVWLILGYFGILDIIYQFSTNFVNDYYPELFGWHLCQPVSNLVESLKHKANIYDIYKFYRFLACLLYIITGPLDLIINLVIGIGLVIFVILYFVLGTIFIYGAGVIFLIPVFIALISAFRDRHKVMFPLLIVLIGIGLAYIYYTNMNVFYNQ